MAARYPARRLDELNAWVPVAPRQVLVALESLERHSLTDWERAETASLRSHAHERLLSLERARVLFPVIPKRPVPGILGGVVAVSPIRIPEYRGRSADEFMAKIGTAEPVRAAVQTALRTLHLAASRLTVDVELGLEHLDLTGSSFALALVVAAAVERFAGDARFVVSGSLTMRDGQVRLWAVEGVDAKKLASREEAPGRQFILVGAGGVEPSTSLADLLAGLGLSDDHPGGPQPSSRRREDASNDLDRVRRATLEHFRDTLPFPVAWRLKHVLDPPGGWSSRLEDLFGAFDELAQLVGTACLLDVESEIASGTSDPDAARAIDNLNLGQSTAGLWVEALLGLPRHISMPFLEALGGSSIDRGSLKDLEQALDSLGAARNGARLTRPIPGREARRIFEEVWPTFDLVFRHLAGLLKGYEMLVVGRQIPARSLASRHIVKVTVLKGASRDPTHEDREVIGVAPAGSVLLRRRDGIALSLSPGYVLASDQDGRAQAEDLLIWVASREGELRYRIAPFPEERARSDALTTKPQVEADPKRPDARARAVWRGRHRFHAGLRRLSGVHLRYSEVVADAERRLRAAGSTRSTSEIDAIRQIALSAARGRSLVVLGGWSGAGKSELLNAIIAERLLPVAPRPCSAIPVVVSPRPDLDEDLAIRHWSGQEAPQEVAHGERIELSRLKTLIDKGKAAAPDEWLELQLAGENRSPGSVLRDATIARVDFVDLPGIDSRLEPTDALMRGILQDSSAICWLFSHLDGPGDIGLRELGALVGSGGARLVPIVTKADLGDGAAEDFAVELGHRLRRAGLGSGVPAVVSAQWLHEANDQRELFRKAGECIDPAKAQQLAEMEERSGVATLVKRLLESLPPPPESPEALSQRLAAIPVGAKPLTKPDRPASQLRREVHELAEGVERRFWLELAASGRAADSDALRPAWRSALRKALRTAIEEADPAFRARLAPVRSAHPDWLPLAEEAAYLLDSVIGPRLPAVRGDDSPVAVATGGIIGVGGAVAPFVGASIAAAPLLALGAGLIAYGLGWNASRFMEMVRGTRTEPVSLEYLQGQVPLADKIAAGLITCLNDAEAGMHRPRQQAGG